MSQLNDFKELSSRLCSKTSRQVMLYKSPLRDSSAPSLNSTQFAHTHLSTHITFVWFVSSVCFVRISVHLFTCVTIVYTFSIICLLNMCTSEHLAHALAVFRVAEQNVNNRFNFACTVMATYWLYLLRVSNELAMPSSCCVVGCVTRRGPKATASGISLFRIPANPRQWRAWVSTIARKDWQPKTWERVCSKHFVSGWPHPDDVDYRPTLLMKGEALAKLILIS